MWLFVLKVKNKQTNPDLNKVNVPSKYHVFMGQLFPKEEEEDCMSRNSKNH